MGFDVNTGRAYRANVKIDICPVAIRSNRDTTAASDMSSSTKVSIEQ